MHDTSHDHGHDPSEKGPEPADWVVELAKRLHHQKGGTPTSDGPIRRPEGSSSAFRQMFPTFPMSTGLAGAGVLDEPFDPDPQGGLGRLGDFRLVREVGRGGMGVVYEAVQISLNRRVALKVLPLAAAIDGRQLTRFQIEAQAAASLQHNHIVPVYATGSERGVPYYAMQYIEGWDLAEVIRRSANNDEERFDREHFRAAAGLGRQAADALEFAHHNEVLHRDIKPSNLLLDGRGKLWITDFGLARVRDQADLTPTGETPGTPRYMSPEQALGRRAALDGRTDIYALGATLYEFVTGLPAFDEEDRLEIRRKIAHEEPTLPRRINPAIPVALETVILKAMAKDPSDRYATAGEMAEDLGRFLNEQPILARRPTLIERTFRWSRQHQRLAALSAGLAVLLVVAIAGGSWWSNAVLKDHNAQLQVEKDRADRNAREAEQLRWTADEGRRLADRHLFAADINLACQALDARQVERAQHILRDASTLRRENEPRGFAWDYLWRQARREVVSLAGTEAKVHTFAVSPDGKTLALTDTGGSLTLRDFHPDRVRMRLTPRGVRASDPAFSPDGQLLAAIETDGPKARRVQGVSIWHAAGHRVARIEPPEGLKSLRFAFLAGGRTIGVESVAADGSRSVRIWDIDGPSRAAPKLVTTLNALTSIAFPASGNGVITGRNDRIQIHDPLSGGLRAEIKGDFARAGSWALSRDGLELAGAVWGRGVVRWDTKTGAEIAAQSVGTPAIALAYGAGKTLAIVDTTGIVSVRDHDLAHSLTIRPDTLKRRRSVWLAFSPDGRWLAISAWGSPGGQQPVTIWDVANRRQAAVFPGRPDQVGALTFSTDGRTVYLEAGQTISLWQPDLTVSTVSVHSPEGHKDEAWSLAFSHDGRFLASGSDDDLDPNTIKLWNVHDSRLIRTFPGHHQTTGALAFDPSGTILAAGYFSLTENLKLWNVNSGALLASLSSHTHRVRTVAFSGDGKILASAGSDNTIRLWDVSSRQTLRVLQGHGDAVRQVSFSPDGHTLLSCGNDGTVRFWDLPAGTLRKTLSLREKIASTLFSPSGRTLAAASESGHLMIWDLYASDPTTPKLIHAEGDELRCLAFTPDSLYIAVSGESGMIRLFDSETGQEVICLRGHARQVNSLTFSPNGRLLASCSHDGAILFWRGDPE